LEEESEDRKLDLAKAVGRIFGIIMVVLYFILGTTFIFYIPDERIPEQYAVPFGIVLYIYGVYRGYKYYRKYWKS